MRGVVYDYLSADHDRLDALLESATANRAAVDMASYSEFRKGLLRHISIEEKIVLPAIAKWQGGRKSALADRLLVPRMKEPYQLIGLVFFIERPSGSVAGSRPGE